MGVNLAFTRARVARFALALLVLAAVTLVGVAPAGARDDATAHASRGSRVFVKTYKVVPKAQRTVHSTGYATYVFKAPSGDRILNASARIVGAQRHAVAITGRSITNQLTSYTVKLVFPGEQGNPGKLVVTLALA